MECAALHTFTMCAHLPRGLQVQIPIAGILTCWCTCSLACPLHIPIGGGICKRILGPVHGCAAKLAPENTPPSAMADQDQIWRGRPRWGSLKTPHRYPKNHPPSHPQANFNPAPRFGCKKRSCVLRAYLLRAWAGQSAAGWPYCRKAHTCRYFCTRAALFE